MSFGSGLGATLGVAQETTVGTYKAPDHFLTFTKESLAWKKNVVQSQAIHGGLYLLGDRRQMVTHTADGTIDLEVYDRSLGVVFANMLGSWPTPTEIGTTGVYQQIFTPGDATGKSFTVQVGRPQTDGTVVPFSYNGGKVTTWSLSVANNSLVDLQVGVDAWNEVTSETYAAPSYVSSNVLSFIEASLIGGGTVTTTAGVATVTGGTPLAYATAVTIKGDNKLDTSRFFLGSAGTKAEQLPNAFRALTGTATMQFANQTDVLNAFYADTPLALQLTITGPNVATSGSQNSGLDILIPQIRWEGAPPNVSGPGVLTVNASFTGLDDGVNPPVQFTYSTLDQQL